MDNSGRTRTALSHQIFSVNEPQVMLLKVRGMITVTHSVSAVSKTLSCRLIQEN